ncbi:uncharacterized protein Z519_05495 [Cladophialophora bantiana CBS 173.52]|uniref:Uncharacterized protein n=1 Tax=Cladophialophora bantiana (strain ATCC 10958 / CBS 173.52 / CDC B-1940 / NIH 8579) TaxID=1442370 RepID=A0A0D2IBI0_CLAB1|nr:uncharacterized protein Z519_05495 [Cladophialophora bantiana CBS 173.52]KIW94179.1 hypothetical protein Z519_05495 [Cladophialophora bantiana CBS 173.52]
MRPILVASLLILLGVTNGAAISYPHSGSLLRRTVGTGDTVWTDVFAKPEKKDDHDDKEIEYEGAPVQVKKESQWKRADILPFPKDEKKAEEKKKEWKRADIIPPKKVEKEEEKKKEWKRADIIPPKKDDKYEPQPESTKKDELFEISPEPVKKEWKRADIVPPKKDDKHEPVVALEPTKKHE